ncbi:diguanylate cyclase [Altererythrobacter sp. B11]|uniref:ammonium transporter n=1 Tax=Altererythrobacter sp. B11 TaxID=2060312 RepID=UPI000DC71675|nr:ammonium transporter [Altererythrobacter sp. B11]BBC73963.1 diguanylate cyclase [Altererythrobacter sp. B11]
MTGILWRALTVLIALCGTGTNALAASAAATGAHTHDRVDSLSATMDMMWVIVAATLVMMMQIGFMMIEAGTVRTKNAISVAQKNMLDFAFSTVAFGAVGFGLAFGASRFWLPIGGDSELFFLSHISPTTATFFIFQVMFCGTCATIVSGAVAERMRLRAYILLSVILSGVVYPVFTQWAWGNALGPSAGAFLANAGFVDFAGSTVVHATGGWFALAACLIIGAREGRFTEGPPIRIGGHSAVLSSAGALFLFVGWIGFNGGSTLAASKEVPGIVLNTILAGSAGGAVGYGMTWFKGAMLPERAVNGMIGGLVAITAGCHLVDPLSALILGATGSLVANAANHFLETRLRIDDAVGAVGVHGVAGVVGTLGLAVLAPAEALPAGSRMAQLLVQAEGSALNMVWSFGIGVVVILGVRTFLALRATPEEEAAGLNAAEHGARLGTDHLQAKIEMLLQSDFHGGERLTVEVGDDNELLTTSLNTLMDKLEAAESARSRQAKSTRSFEETQRLAAFGEVASECILLIHDGRIRSANAAAAELFGCSVEELIERAPAELVHPDLRHSMIGWLETGNDALQHARVLGAHGLDISVELRFRQIELDGHEVIVLRMTDLSEREEAQRQIYHLAMHDPLTDLPNRELFNRKLRSALARRPETMLTALLLIDIDRFKDINDLHGHPSGDTVLIAVAERLRDSVRGCDTVARLGGDEFAVVYTSISFPNQALDLAYRLLQSVSQPLVLPTGTTIHPRASIGLAICPLDAEDMDVLCRNADMALYAAKKRGRNGFQRYKPEMGRLQHLRRELEDDLSQAVARNELELYYQPRIDMQRSEVVGFEALLRWNRRGVLISPVDFISIAEETGLIVPIGAWAIREACRAAMQDLGGTCISVNVSARQFHSPQLIESVTTALAESGLPPANLELEITESVLIDEDDVAGRVLNELRKLGVGVALDDFGTGYSSLSYLTRFAFDTIKIDRSFIQAEDEKTWYVIRSVLNMSAGLGTAVVAEGVETMAQLDRLTAEGCSLIQGFLFSKPLPADQAVQFVNSGAHLAPLTRQDA